LLLTKKIFAPVIILKIHCKRFLFYQADDKTFLRIIIREETIQTIFVRLNPFPFLSIDTPFLSKEHLETIKLEDQAMVNNITVLPANVLYKMKFNNKNA